MRYLNLIEKDYILKLGRVSYYTALSYDSLAADKCTLSNFCIFSYDTGTCDAGGRSYFCRLSDPDVSKRADV